MEAQQGEAPDDLRPATASYPDEAQTGVLALLENRTISGKAATVVVTAGNVRPVITILEVDLSTVYPRFEAKSETRLEHSLSDEAILEDMLDHELFARMPPKKSYRKTVNIASIKKPLPKVVKVEDSP